MSDDHSSGSWGSMAESELRLAAATAELSAAALELSKLIADWRREECEEREGLRRKAGRLEQ